MDADVRRLKEDLNKILCHVNETQRANIVILCCEFKKKKCEYVELFSLSKKKIKNVSNARAMSKLKRMLLSNVIILLFCVFLVYMARLLLSSTRKVN